MATFELKCNRFVWTNIVHPTRADIEQLRAAHPDIHPLHLEDLLSQTERPKIDEGENYLLVVMHFPAYDFQNRVMRPSEVEFIIGRNYLVTVHQGTLKPLIRLFARCELYASERNTVFGKGANDAFYALIDHLVDSIFPILRDMDITVREIEEQIFSADARSIIREISLVRRDAIALRRIIRHQVPILEALERTEHRIIREDLEEYFGDTVDHLLTARDIVDENYEVIAGLAETADTLLNHRINEVMRMLTVISVIMLPLTLVSGIYGMNIELPLQEHPVAFILVAMMMILIALSMLFYFKRRGWI